MKKIIPGIILALSLTACGDSDLFTSVAYKQKLVSEMQSKDKMVSEKALKEYGKIYNKLANSKDPRAYDELKKWAELIKRI